MLSKFLSLNGPLAAKRSTFPALLASLDFSTIATAAVGTAAHPKILPTPTAVASSPSTFHPHSTTTTTTTTDRVDPSTSIPPPQHPHHPSAAHLAASQPKSTTATSAAIQKASPPPPAAATQRNFKRSFFAILANGDFTKCVAILERYCLRGLSSKTSYAFERAMLALPPHQGLQIYNLSREKGVTPTVGMAVAVIKVYAAMGMLRHIEGAVKDLIAAGARSHWSIYFHWASVHAEAGLPDGVTSAASAAEAAGVEVTSHYQTMMVKALGKSGNHGRTVDLLRELRESGQVPPEPVWRAIIHCHGLAGHASRAQVIFDEMIEAGIVPGLPTWTALINAYAECRMPQQAVEALAGMHAAGFKGNTHTYTVLLKVCAHAADAAVAHSVVEQMRRDGLTPTKHVWGALIYACAAAGDTSAANAAFNAMQESGCVADVVPYTALLTAYRYANDVSGGLQVLKRMDEDGVRPGKKTFTELIMLLGQQGMIKEAEEAFVAMKSQGHQPDQVAFNVLVGALMQNWVDEGRDPESPLLLSAEEVFLEGWQIGTTRPPREIIGEGKLWRVDLHCQGTWSAQFAVLCVLTEMAESLDAEASSNSDIPSLMLITGHGLKKGKAPLREAVWTMLQNMGIHARVALGNGGTLIVPHWAIKRGIKFSRQGTFDVYSNQKCLADPRIVDDGGPVVEEEWGRLDGEKKDVVQGEEWMKFGTLATAVGGGSGGLR